MKIISKYKDYYDYLQGSFGIDNKVVLDRSKGTVLHINDLAPYEKGTYNRYQICICDYKWDVVVSYSKNVYIGDHIRIIATKGYKNGYYIPTGYREKAVVFIHERATDVNQKEKCPIVFINYGHNILFPRLSDLKMASVYPAQELFIELYNWIVRFNNPEFPDKRTDIQKVESHGFDKKTSFRNM